MKAHKINVPKIGMRKIKSLISVVVAFLIWQIFRIPMPQMSAHPLFGYAYAIIEMRDSIEKTKTFGKIRIKATLIGLFFGILFMPLSVYVSKVFENAQTAIFVDLLIVLVGVVASLTFAEVLGCESFCGVAAVIFVICIIRDRNTDTDIYLYAIMRVVQTIIGIFSAWLVNKFVYRYPRGGKKMKLMGIDIGTTSVKACCFNEKLEQLSSSNVDYRIESHGDIVEFDALKYWQIVKEEIEKLEISPDALAIDTQCETLILTDEEGNPVRKAIVWLDNRAVKEAEEIQNHFGCEKVYNVTGQPEITATWPACKLLWVRKNEPEVWEKTKKIFLLEDYILYKLTGKFVTEKTLQSSTIYFDIKNSCYWKEMLEFIGVDEKKLPELEDSGKYIGDYNGIKIVTGAMDQVSGAIGAGVINSDIISEMTGTTMVIFNPCEKIPEYDKDSIVPCHYNYDGKYCLLSWSPTAGMALKWFKNALCEEFSFKELDELAKNVNVGSDGLTFLPYLCGSTMPKYNPDARGSFTGITPEHTRGHFARSIMESVSCMLKANLEYLASDAKEIRAMGGGASSELWCQMKADMTKKTLITLENAETACLGGAILAGVGTGVFKSVEEACKMIKTKKKYTPDDVDYNEVYERYNYYDDILNVRR